MMVGRERDRESITVGERTGDGEEKNEKDTALLVDFLLFLFYSVCVPGLWHSVMHI